jgi:putative hydrolase of the HAD superfamily
VIGAAVRAVVFDLDDTLYDCWRRCVLPAHREAARAMVAAGLGAPEEEVARRRRLLAGIEEDLDAVVARSFPCSDPVRVAQAGRRAFFVRDPGPLAPHPFAREILAAVRTTARTVLLTSGDPATQRRKLDRLRLSDAFDEVLLDDIVEGTRRPSKREMLERFLHRAGLAPREVLVVGDRPGAEIRAAQEIGCPALRIRAGEFAAIPTPAGVSEAPDIRAVLPLLAARGARRGIA